MLKDCVCNIIDGVYGHTRGRFPASFTYADFSGFDSLPKLTKALISLREQIKQADRKTKSNFIKDKWPCGSYRELESQSMSRFSWTLASPGGPDLPSSCDHRGYRLVSELGRCLRVLKPARLMGSACRRSRFPARKPRGCRGVLCLVVSQPGVSSSGRGFGIKGVCSEEQLPGGSSACRAPPRPGLHQDRSLQPGRLRRDWFPVSLALQWCVSAQPSFWRPPREMGAARGSHGQTAELGDCQRFLGYCPAEHPCRDHRPSHGVKGRATE